MKVCLYLEGESVLKKSGIGVALKRQMSALEKAGIEYTTSPHEDYDILHINTILPKSLIYAKLAKSRGKKVIMHAHTLEEDTRNSFTGSNTIAPLFKRYLSHFYKNADHIICPSPYAKEMLSTYGLGNIPITPISNGTDLDFFKFSKEGREKYRERYMLDDIAAFSVGHVFMRKGPDTFINVAKEFKNPFIWFGNVFNGALVKDSRLAEAMASKPENVKFTGYVDDIVAAYSAGDIFFFPSRAETQGLVILEAWAMERPLLIRDLPVFRDWTHDGENCLRALDETDFAEKLRWLIDDKALRERLVRGGKKAVKEHSMENIGKELKRVYTEVLNES
jgi:1,2-diacylglycerol-3-alpha-glucose alpha-1,2-glucosyltransferase